MIYMYIDRDRDRDKHVFWVFLFFTLTPTGKIMPEGRAPRQSLWRDGLPQSAAYTSEQEETQKLCHSEDQTKRTGVKERRRGN